MAISGISAVPPPPSILTPPTTLAVENADLENAASALTPPINGTAGTIDATNLNQVTNAVPLEIPGPGEAIAQLIDSANPANLANSDATNTINGGLPGTSTAKDTSLITSLKELQDGGTTQVPTHGSIIDATA